MSQRNFMILLLASLVLGTAVMMVSRNGSDQSDQNGSLLIGELSDRINEVSEIRLSAGATEPQSTLSKLDSGWVVRELSDYPADWGKLKTLLNALREAVVTENKTSNPEYYSRLGVEDPGQEGVGSTLMAIGLGDKEIALILGNTASTRGGQYIRKQGDQQSVLIDKEFNAETDPVSWADSSIVDIGSAQVAGIEIVHADGDAIHACKVSADDTDFRLLNLPENRKTLSSWSVNSLANIFSSLNMETVEPDTGQSSEERTEIKLLMFSGLALEAEVFKVEDSGWLRLKASAPFVSDEAPMDKVEGEALAGENLVTEATRINQKVASWVYRLPDSKFEMMTRKLDQLLEPLEGEGATDS
jgi:hypothetical protein